jgi:YHS domain-containing protein
MTFWLRLVAWVAAVLLLRGLWRRLFGRPALRALVDRGALHRDPVCGTFVDADVGVTQARRGQVFYFCSERCRQSFEREQPLPLP